MATIALRPDSVCANPVLSPADSIRDVPRAAPVVPASRHSLAARAKPSLLRRLLLAIEPWYDWGTINTFRLDVNSLAESDANEFEVRTVELQWLGIALEFRFGRMPAKVSL